MLIIQPIGGLCNRIRAINSALVLKEKRNEDLIVIWNINSELGCAFEELFTTPTDFKVINIHSKWNIKKVLYQLICKPLGNDEIRKKRDAKGNLPDDFVKELPKKLYIATEEHFFEAHDYSNFNPTPEIIEGISKLTSRFSAHNVGIHIRRTDNKPAIGKSSTEAFTKAMEKELEKDPSTMFYLATDDMGEEANLRKLFEGHILSNETRDLSRDSVSGIKDALIDLMCLSKTDKIIGSFFSSFTDMAADLGGIEKKIAGEDD